MTATLRASIPATLALTSPLADEEGSSASHANSLFISLKPLLPQLLTQRC